ncbi:MAG: ATP-dependent DNA helicase RecG [Lachnospiraceae bacterium]|nr:ATP-dependent DNA helicase RecG [Lachnospiraceae bacterium]
MTDLTTLEISNNRIAALRKKGIGCVEDIQRFFPRTYFDFSTQSELDPKHHDQHIAIIGRLDKVVSDKTNDTLMLKAKVYDEISEKKLNVMWIGSYYLKNTIKKWEDSRVIVCGKLTYREEFHSFHMNNPLVFDKDVEENLRIYPVYRKMANISEEFMKDTIEKALSYPAHDPIPASYRNKYHLMEINTALHTMHHPQSMKELTDAKKRLTYEKLLHFAVQIEKKERHISKGTIYNIKGLKNTYDYIQSLPFMLTPSQSSVFQSMRDMAYNGQRINALVQGDVGSGKTIQAFLMMFSMADSGYQSILVAPTQILAKQHYESLQEASQQYGYQVAFLSSETKGRAKKKILEGIAEGQYTFVVGTHSVINPDIQYKNLALVVIDEEHKFGVSQRNLLTAKAELGVHCITMSGTPIPRTLASALYGPSIQVYDLEVPSERKPVQTAVSNNDRVIFEFIKEKVMSGNQAYVVCPWIEDEEDTSNIETVEKAMKSYQDYFSSYHPEISINYVTGKMKPEESAEIISAFDQGQIDILISTTVIEVGVNVPNANVIVINNAENFGLAQLHQLRGRVGRGSGQGYCILKSTDRENARLQVMCQTTSGLKIAEEDMRLRGSGNILGTEQSGQNEYIELITHYPNMYNKAKFDAKDLVDQGIDFEP